jgi:DnaB helicase-like protein
VVDYLRLVEAPGRELRERVGYVANALRELAKSERIGVVMLSQLRRPDGGMNSKPTMLDLKESGDIEKQIRRGVHRSTLELEHAIRGFIDHHNQNPKPFVWTKSADQILESVARFCKRTLDSVH